jgi:hypothetical protein
MLSHYYENSLEYLIPTFSLGIYMLSACRSVVIDGMECLLVSRGDR